MTQQTESEWDEDSRRLVEGLWRHDREVHPVCGLHESVASNPEEHAFNIVIDNCPACAAMERYRRVMADEDHEWDEQHKNAEPRTPRPGDGRLVHLQPLTPEEAARRRKETQGGRPPS